MDSFGVLGSFWNLLGYVGPFLFVLGLVIFVHEYGHYIVGRWCGVGVEAFSIGFGPRLFGWRDRHGTEWKLSAIPLGGYVKFRGDLNAASMPDDAEAARMDAAERAVAFQFKPVWKRASIVAAGPIFNFILAFVIFTGSLLYTGSLVLEPVVGAVSPNSAAERGGLKAGDRILSINGDEIASFDALRHAVTSSETDSLSLEVQRQSRIESVNVVAPVVEQRSRFGVYRARLLGVSSSTLPEHRRYVTYGPIEAAGAAGSQVVGVISQSMRFLGGLVMGRENPDQLSGPLRIAQVSGVVAQTGFLSLLNLVAIVSISIGFINLLPVPLLDGGHLMFYAYEAVFGRPLSRRSQEVFFRIGFAFVMMLMVFSVFNDVFQMVR